MEGAGVDIEDVHHVAPHGFTDLRPLLHLPRLLPPRLEAIAGARTGKEPPQVFLRADRALDYGRVMKVMGELNRAGLTRVALVTVGED